MPTFKEFIQSLIVGLVNEDFIFKHKDFDENKSVKYLLGEVKHSLNFQSNLI
jgi:hypothetical protein